MRPTGETTCDHVPGLVASRGNNPSLFRLAVPKPVPSLSMLEQMQSARRSKAPGMRGFCESPLTDSNRQPPPYHGGSFANGYNQYQTIASSCAVCGAGAFANGCHRLRP